MTQIVSRFVGDEDTTAPADSGQLLAMVDALHAGTLNDSQRNTVQSLRTGILAIAQGRNDSRT